MRYEMAGGRARFRPRAATTLNDDIPRLDIHGGLRRSQADVYPMRFAAYPNAICQSIGDIYLRIPTNFVCSAALIR